MLAITFQNIFQLFQLLNLLLIDVLLRRSLIIVRDEVGVVLVLGGIVVFREHMVDWGVVKLGHEGLHISRGQLNNLVLGNRLILLSIFIKLK